MSPLWTPWAMIALTERFDTVPVADPWLDEAFFRAPTELPQELPRLFVRKADTNYIFTSQGAPGTQYAIEGMEEAIINPSGGGAGGGTGSVV